jgi:tRNA(Arg) A34 adenosine deaminase TadA
MNRRNFVQLSGLGVLAGGALACGANKTPDNNSKTSINTASNITERELGYLELAIQLSDLSSLPESGENDPFGAAIVLADGTVIKGHNHVRSYKDPTQHAELFTLSQACRSGLEARNFKGATLYTSTEPCAMCCGATYWVGIRRVVFACGHDSLNKLFLDMFPASTEGGGLMMSSREIFAKGASQTDVLGPYLEEKAIAIHKKHWPRLLNVPAPAQWKLNG